MVTGKALKAIARATTRERVLIAGRLGYGAGVSELPDKLGALGDVISVLEQVRAPYALIGGLAVGIHTNIPRATLDVHLAVLSTTDRAALIKAMQTAGFRLTGEFPHSLNFRHSSEEPVQLAFDPEFDAMIARAETIAVDGLSIHVVNKDDLIAMKRRAAADPERRRSKALRDQADLALLEGDLPDPEEGW